MVFHLEIASVLCGSGYPAVMISVPHTQYQPKKLLALNSLISYFLKLISYICQKYAKLSNFYILAKFLFRVQFRGRIPYSNVVLIKAGFPIGKKHALK